MPRCERLGLLITALIAACASEANPPQDGSTSVPTAGNGGAAEVTDPAVDLPCMRGQLRVSGTLDGQAVDVVVDDAVASLGSAARATDPAALIFDEQSVFPDRNGYLELRYVGAIYTTARKRARASIDLERLAAGMGRYGNCQAEAESVIVVGEKLSDLRFGLRGLRRGADCDAPAANGELSGCFWAPAFE
jgi:hypothetical protein